jgi:hypothetical protein
LRETLSARGTRARGGESGARAFVAWHAAGWLGAEDAPAKADAILVLGAEPTRAITGAELYRKGYAGVVYLSVPRRESRWAALEQDGIRWPWFEETARALLRNRGVPDEAIRLLGKDLASTVAEAAEAARTPGPARTPRGDVALSRLSHAAGLRRYPAVDAGARGREHGGAAPPRLVDRPGGGTQRRARVPEAHLLPAGNELQVTRARRSIVASTTAPSISTMLPTIGTA